MSDFYKISRYYAQGTLFVVNRVDSAASQRWTLFNTISKQMTETKKMGEILI